MPLFKENTALHRKQTHVVPSLVKQKGNERRTVGKRRGRGVQLQDGASEGSWRRGVRTGRQRVRCTGAGGGWEDRPGTVRFWEHGGRDRQGRKRKSHWQAGGKDRTLGPRLGSHWPGAGSGRRRTELDVDTRPGHRPLPSQHCATRGPEPAAPTADRAGAEGDA